MSEAALNTTDEALPNPLATMDARVWAQEFMRLFGHNLSAIDEGLMVGWFANSIMRGFDAACDATKKREDEKFRNGFEEGRRLGFDLGAADARRGLEARLDELARLLPAASERAAADVRRSLQTLIEELRSQVMRVQERVVRIDNRQWPAPAKPDPWTNGLLGVAVGLAIAAVFNLLR